MISTLDSNRLLNLKQRHGISICSGNTTGIYIVSRKCEKKMKNKLSHLFRYQSDLDILISKIIDKINDIDIFNVLINYIENSTSEQILQDISKTKSFISSIRKIVDKKEEEEIEENLEIADLF